MALFILNPGISPLGDFDLLDTDAAALDGGEVMTIDEASRTNTSTEKAAADVLDGYIADAVDVGTPTGTRVIARIADDNSETYKFFCLADDGTANYGVTFGSVVGGTVGLTVTSTNLGPNTTTGSGKVTLWDKPGLYAVTTGMCILGTTSGLNDTPLPGQLLYRSTAGLQVVTTHATASSDKISLFIELAGNGSLVTTPNRLVGATESFDRVKIQFLGATHNA